MQKRSAVVPNAAAERNAINTTMKHDGSFSSRSPDVEREMEIAEAT
mgnify:CR=1 FL=1